MTGKREEHYFGPGCQILLIEYQEAAYLKDDNDNVRILFTGFKDKSKAREKAKRLADYYENKVPHKNLFVKGGTSDVESDVSDTKSL